MGPQIESRWSHSDWTWMTELDAGCRRLVYVHAEAGVLGSSTSALSADVLRLSRNADALCVVAELADELDQGRS